MGENKGVSVIPCLLLNFLDLPKEMQQVIKERHSFRNDIYLEFISEFSPENGQTWASVLTEQSIVAYWTDQVKYNGYKYDLEHFITDYGLAFEKWLLTLDPSLLNVELILIRVCW